MSVPDIRPALDLALTIPLSVTQVADLKKLQTERESLQLQWNIYCRAVISGVPIEGRERDAVNVDLAAGVITLTPPVKG